MTSTSTNEPDSIWRGRWNHFGWVKQVFLMSPTQLPITIRSLYVPWPWIFGSQRTSQLQWIPTIGGHVSVMRKTLSAIPILYPTLLDETKSKYVISLPTACSPKSKTLFRVHLCKPRGWFESNCPIVVERGHLKSMLMSNSSYWSDKWKLTQAKSSPFAPDAAMFSFGGREGLGPRPSKRQSVFRF